MKRIIIALSPLVLSACITFPQKTEFPDPPELAMDPPPSLVLLSDKADLKELGVVINKNYTQYNIISNQLIMLQTWVIEQKNKGKKDGN